MSVKSAIDRIKQNIANVYAVLTALGADLPDEQNSDNLATTAGTAKVLLFIKQVLTDAQKQADHSQRIHAPGFASRVHDYRLGNRCDKWQLQ